MATRLVFAMVVAGLAGGCGNQTRMAADSAAVSQKRVTAAPPAVSQELGDEAASASTHANVGETLVHIDTQASPGPSGSPVMPTLNDANNSILPPQAVTGSYLMSCAWSLQGYQMRCQVTSSTPASGMQDSQLNVVVVDPSGTPLEASSYTVTKFAQGSGVDLRITFQVFSPAVNVQVINAAAPQSTPITVTNTNVSLGRVSIRAKHSSKCISVEGASREVGAGLRQVACSNAEHQLFSLGANPDGSYVIKTFADKCTDAFGPSNSDWVPFGQNDCFASSTQSYKLAKQVDGSYTISTLLDKCMNVWGGSVAEREAIVQMFCTAAENERFFIEAAP